MQCFIGRHGLEDRLGVPGPFRYMSDTEMGWHPSWAKAREFVGEHVGHNPRFGNGSVQWSVVCFREELGSGRKPSISTGGCLPNTPKTRTHVDSRLLRPTSCPPIPPSPTRRRPDHRPPMSATYLCTAPSTRESQANHPATVQYHFQWLPATVARRRFATRALCLTRATLASPLTTRTKIRFRHEPSPSFLCRLFSALSATSLERKPCCYQEISRSVGRV